MNRFSLPPASPVLTTPPVTEPTTCSGELGFRLACDRLFASMRQRCYVGVGYSSFSRWESRSVLERGHFTGRREGGEGVRCDAWVN